MLEGTEEEWNPITLRRKNKNATIDFLHLKICFSGGLFILAKVLFSHSGPENLKKSRQKKIREIKFVISQSQWEPENLKKSRQKKIREIK